MPELEEKDVMEGSHEGELTGEEDKSAGPDKEIGQPDDTPQKDQEDSWKPKFKSWEDAEKSYGEAHKKITSVSEDNARIRKRLEEIERSKEPPRDEVLEKKKAIRDETLKKIKSLPYKYTTNEEGERVPLLDDSEREAQIADLWLDAQAQVTELVSDTRETKRKNESEGQAYVSSKLEEAGFKDQVEKDLFWNSVVPRMPKYLHNAPMDDQIEWGTQELTKLVTYFQERFDKGSKEDREQKDKLNVLGRGSNVQSRGKKDRDDQGLISIRDQQKMIREEMSRKT